MVDVRLHVLVVKKRDRKTVKMPIIDTSSRATEGGGGAVTSAAVALFKSMTGLQVNKNGPSFPIFLITLAKRCETVWEYCLSRECKVVGGDLTRGWVRSKDFTAS